MSDRSNLILDCDPGIDDALALWMAAAQSERITLRAVTTVTGNRPVAATTRNALALLQAAGRSDVPVHAGAALPVHGGPARCNLVHGKDGLGGVALPATGQAQPQAASDFLVQCLWHEPEGTVDLAAVGPLTNLALAERQRPGTLRRVRRLLIMGGALNGKGNVTPRAEFNFWADPTAAHEVLQAGARTWVFGLDVTRAIDMHAAWKASWQHLNGRCAKAARVMLRTYTAHDPLLHDACPIAWLLQPHLFAGERHAVRVELAAGADEGALLGAPAAETAATTPGIAEVVLQGDREGVLALMKDSLARLP